jgi:hypothetical protein
MKKALLVGINDYPGTYNDLMGCVNDVENMHDLLSSLFGFGAEDIRILTDGDATTLNILKALEMLVFEAKPGDHLVFHYSGHGSQVPDTSGDEKDGADEILCPYDLDWRENVIKDDDLNRIFQSVPKGVHVEVFLDSCHSGTGLKTMDGSCSRQRFLPALAEIMAECREIKFIRSLRPAKIQVLWAACRSNQYASDAFLNGKYGGAFTTFLCDLVRSHQAQIPRKALLSELRETLKKNRFTQSPQLETTTKLRKAQFFST